VPCVSSANSSGSTRGWNAASGRPQRPAFRSSVLRAQSLRDRALSLRCNNQILRALPSPPRQLFELGDSRVCSSRTAGANFTLRSSASRVAVVAVPDKFILPFDETDFVLDAAKIDWWLPPRR